MYKGKSIQGHLEKFDFINGSTVSFSSDGNKKSIWIKLHHGPSNVFETQLLIDPTKDIYYLIGCVNDALMHWVCLEI